MNPTSTWSPRIDAVIDQIGHRRRQLVTDVAHDSISRRAEGMTITSGKGHARLSFRAIFGTDSAGRTPGAGAQCRPHWTLLAQRRASAADQRPEVEQCVIETCIGAVWSCQLVEVESELPFTPSRSRTRPTMRVVLVSMSTARRPKPKPRTALRRVIADAGKREERRHR